MERDLVEAFKSRLGPVPSWVVRGIGDDAACLETPPPGLELVWTTDTQREGVHFRWDWFSPEAVGYRLFVINASDVIAKGGTPYAALVAIGIPAGFSEEKLLDLYEGISEGSREFSCPVVGGDISRSRGDFNVVLSLLGTVPKGLFRGRGGLESGNVLYLVGRPGLARAGYMALAAGRGDEEGLREAVQTFRRPRTFMGWPGFLGSFDGITATMDTSDGLGQAVWEMASESRVTIRLAFPEGWIGHLREPSERLSVDPFRLAWEGGEDYDIVVGVRRDREREFVERAGKMLESTRDSATRIGEVIESGDSPVVCRNSGGIWETLKGEGFDHTRI
jgi:thiamine-monophosphate kinase